MSIDFADIQTATDTRTGLNNTLQRFRADGMTAEPVVFGSHRKPEGVVLPWAMYERLLPIVENILIAETVRERINDSHTPVAFDDAARALGFSPDEF